jgi:hypothetical protein
MSHSNFQIVNSSSEWKEMPKELLMKVTNETFKRLAKRWDSVYIYSNKSDGGDDSRLNFESESDFSMSD